MPLSYNDIVKNYRVYRWLLYGISFVNRLMIDNEFEFGMCMEFHLVVGWMNSDGKGYWNVHGW